MYSPAETQTKMMKMNTHYSTVVADVFKDVYYNHDLVKSRPEMSQPCTPQCFCLVSVVYITRRVRFGNSCYHSSHCHSGICIRSCMSTCMHLIGQHRALLDCVALLCGNQGFAGQPYVFLFDGPLWHCE